MLNRMVILVALVTAAVSCVAASTGGQVNGVELAKGGRSAYRIVVSSKASNLEMRAAQELRSFVKQVSGAVLPIVTDDRPIVDEEIVVGQSRRLEGLGIRPDVRKLGREGFTIRTVGRRLAIVGGSERGTLYGVYTFLEDHLGCRWYTPTVSRIPKMDSITLGRIDETQTPAMEYRELYYSEAREHVFCTRVKLNVELEGAQPGEQAEELIAGNALCHTLFSFLSPDKYFSTHPEYFALRDGKREPTQLCLSNPDVLRIVTERLAQVAAANPKIRHWNVSQMDNGEYCTCDKCKAVDDAEGSPIGSVLRFVNQVAAKFPDKTISTLSYWYTMCPPKTMRPARNVLVVFCYDGNPREPFRTYLRDWAKVAPLHYTWYYAVPAHNSLAPWPTLNGLQCELKTYYNLGTRGMFVEGSNEKGSEFAELRVYMLAKLMWNPDCDGSAVMNDFLNGYYGAAGPFIRNYIDMMEDSLKSTGDALDGHDWCRQHAGTFLAPAMLAKYDTVFDQAEKAVAGDPDLLLRVQHARMPLMHAEIQLRYGDVDARIATVQRLRDIAVRSDTRFFADFGSRPTEAYLTQVMDGLAREKSGK